MNEEKSKHRKRKKSRALDPEEPDVSNRDGPLRFIEVSYGSADDVVDPRRTLQELRAVQDDETEPSSECDEELELEFYGREEKRNQGHEQPSNQPSLAHAEVKEEVQRLLFVAMLKESISGSACKFAAPVPPVHEPSVPFAGSKCKAASAPPPPPQPHTNSAASPAPSIQPIAKPVLAPPVCSPDGVQATTVPASAKATVPERPPCPRATGLAGTKNEGFYYVTCSWQIWIFC